MLTLSVYVLIILVWLGLFMIAVRKKGTTTGRWLSKVVYSLFVLGILELVSVGTYRIYTGLWAFQPPPTKNHLLYEYHPYLVAMPVKSIEVKFEGNWFSHNSQGFRGPQWDAPKKRFRIAAVGGSTTYGIGVDDRETWPYYLDSILGPEYEVLNMGVPGHSTVEHVILSNLILPEYEPDLVVYHTGINDIGNMHIENLQPDYSDFHAPLLYGATSQCFREHLPPVGIIKFSAWLLQVVGFYPECYYHQMEQKGQSSTQLDPEAVRLYTRNLHTLDRNARALDAHVLFIPQLLTQEAASQGNLKWWIPYVENDALKEHLNVYNAEMEKVSGPNYVRQIEDQPWTVADFADPCHLNAQGNLRFATTLASRIRKIATATDTVQSSVSTESR